MKELTVKQQEILENAIKVFGTDAQIEMIIEECLELALSLQKLKRLRGDMTQKIYNVCDEIADVRIMLEQAFKIFNENNDLINSRIDFKIDRLENRIKEKVV